MYIGIKEGAPWPIRMSFVEGERVERREGRVRVRCRV